MRWPESAVLTRTLNWSMACCLAERRRPAMAAGVSWSGLRANASAAGSSRDAARAAGTGGGGGAWVGAETKLGNGGGGGAWGGGAGGAAYLLSCTIACG